jgi:hypothetical protein
LKWLLIAVFIPLGSWAQVGDAFHAGTQELGLANLGLGYSDPGGFAVSANVRYQYYFINRVSAGGFGFYNNFAHREWMGVGPSLSYILLTYQDFFLRLDQQITFSKMSGFSDPPATTYGTTGLSVNYLPFQSNFFIGVGYARNYALSAGEVIFPDTILVSGGWLWTY